MDWDKFRERAKQVVPYELEPTRCWVSVLHHAKTSPEQIDEEDFLWMNGRDSTVTQKVYDNYKTRFNIADFYLEHRGHKVNTSDTVSTFRSPHDSLVLFRAVLDDQSGDPTQTSHAEGSNTAVSKPGAEPHPSGASSADRSLTIKLKVKGRSSHQDLSTASLGLQDSADVTMSVEDYQIDTNLPKDHFIREIIEQESPDALEAAVIESLGVLDTLKSCFVQHASYSQDARSWIDSIEDLSLQSKRKRTVIGVVGNTGAGKSSVINALLDEERLVPTNCMRACTAVVTEISWNSNTNPGFEYRAKVEFISPEDWEKELKVLMSDFISDSGKLSREASDTNTDAGIAWAKFHAVYPHITRDSLHQCDISDLLARPGMKILGTIRKIRADNPLKFYQKLQKYVDSKEKVIKKESKATGESASKSAETPAKMSTRASTKKPAKIPAKKSQPAKKGKAVRTKKRVTYGKTTKKSTTKKKRGEPRSMEFWPLIKVVKIYTKAPALSTGAVIVDLPGVHDSNAARAAVAQRYLQQCTGLWIVAPINRAVDDKAAKTLLGDSFKMQLKYDGGFSSVTFICSKTDDISLTEATEALGLRGQVAHLYEQENSHKEKIEEIRDEVEKLREEQENLSEISTNTSQELEEWIGIQEDFTDGKKVYAPAPRSLKRKRNSLTIQASKRHQIESEGIIFSNPAVEDIASSDDDSEEMTVVEPLKEPDIRHKLRELREISKNARTGCGEVQKKIGAYQSRIPQLETEIAEIKLEISRICISGRNEYSKHAIQLDFAAGIKELDQEMAAEEDDESFDPDEERRDYDQIAQSLPVFCVSSRAYQQHRGRLQQDDVVPGFTTVEETEMPQLQLHSQKVTEVGRIQTARSFLLGLCQQLTTFELWASDDNSSSLMTKTDKIQQRKSMKKPLTELEEGLRDAVRACILSMSEIMDEQIFNRYPEVIKEAIELAPETVQGWGGNKGDGGLAWGTYKAVVRRDGTFHSATAGQRDFNAELVEPIIKKLATGWERAFQTRLPKAFKTFTKDSGNLLRISHEAIKQIAEKYDLCVTKLSALETQIDTYEALFEALNLELVTAMSKLQREANRDFSPTISSIMHKAYIACAEERGRGSYSRMKKYMTAHIDSHRHTMFGKATDTVKVHLDAMCRTLEDTMLTKTDEIYTKIKADYTRAVLGIQADAVAAVGKEEKILRKKILDLLQSVNIRFAPIAKGRFVRHDGIGDADSEGSDDEDEQYEETDDDDDDESHSSDQGSAILVKIEDNGMDVMNDDSGSDSSDEEPEECDDSDDGDYVG